MIKDKLDQLLKDVCESKYDDINGLKEIDVPAMEKTWATFRHLLHSQPELMAKTPVRSFGIKKCLSFAACFTLIMLFLFITWNTPQSQAIRARIVNTRIFVNGNTTTIKQSDTDHATLPKGSIPPPPDDFNGYAFNGAPSDFNSRVECMEEIKQEEIPVFTLALEEAASIVPFALLLPEYLPVGYEIKDVTVKAISDDFYIVEQRYENEANQQIRIRQNYGIKQFASSTSTVLEVDHLEVMGSEAFLITNRVDYSMVYWHKNESRYEISGSIPDTEMRKVLENLSLNGAVAVGQ